MASAHKEKKIDIPLALKHEFSAPSALFQHSPQLGFSAAISPKPPYHHGLNCSISSSLPIPIAKTAKSKKKSSRHPSGSHPPQPASGHKQNLPEDNKTKMPPPPPPATASASASASSPPVSPSTTAHDGNGPVDFDVAVPKCPATAERRQAVDADAFLSKPGIARANLAPSAEKPDGSREAMEKFGDYTVLQQHVLFWDRDGDGQIYPWDTYFGFRDLGFSILFSLLAVVIINVNFSYPTRLAVSWVPDPFFRVYVGGIHKAKHGSDSGVYDKEGRFVPQMFEDMFSKWDVNNTGSLSAGELWRMIKGNRLAADPFGWGAAIFEFGTTWFLIQKDGRVSKEDLRQTYDGTVFWRIKKARESGKGWDKGFGLRDLVDFVLSNLKTAYVRVDVKAGTK